MIFYDYAEGENVRMVGEDDGVYQKEAIASVGLGLRYAFGKDINAQFDVAKVRNEGDDASQHVGNWRGHFSVNLAL